jgi:hypothetical protein
MRSVSAFPVLEVLEHRLAALALNSAMPYSSISFLF